MESANPLNSLSYNVFAARCRSRKAFDQIFSRWGILVLARLADGTMRFGELRRAVDGISERMLSRTLKALEEERLIVRREWDENVPRVEYSLTESGQKMSESIISVISVLYEEIDSRAT